MVADVEVLAEHTAQIAAGKENRARAAFADKDAFLAEVRTNRTNYWIITNATKSGFTLITIDFTFTRTECAGIH